ncbi:hypothetical protein J0X15_12300 [Roseibium sp. CAU 1637]|uniref:RiboL-PSP-HEPN domain-containing protein n=1 Tax=Roseibium limicola TaxID=2816037 RepID=A0A939EQB5_9HYPH|nr:hypothetical protein [Roseibium limicola]MBO0346006.1 hypothetical protein [Roseibium limicola]
MSAKTLENNLMHSRAAYLHAVRALPSSNALQFGSIKHNGMEFSNKNQIESQLVELGWAFFCRYEGCLEKWLKDQKVKLSRKYTLKNWLTDHQVTIPEELSAGIDLYRRIRNALHHDDGATFDGSGEPEFHLLPEQMEKFFQLFCWIGQQVEQAETQETGLEE